MKTTLRLSLALTLLCLIASVIALLAGKGLPTDRLPLRFDPDPFVIPVVMVEHVEYDFEVPLANDSYEPVRIIGVEEFCSSACFYGRGLPVVIAPRAEGRISIRVKANSPGPVSDKVNFFTDQPSQPKLTMRIEGSIRGNALDEVPKLSSSQP